MRQPHRVLLFLLAALLLGAPRTFAAPAKAWEVWDYCRLATDKYFDGDSFHIQHGSETMIVRLYLVDAPETDAGYGERIKEQAAYFRTTEAAVLRAGGTARDLTARFLKKPFRVITRRQGAPGASRDARYYALAEQDGRRLDAALVEAGLARVTSEIADYPDSAAGQKTVRALRGLEAKAAQEHRGLWAKSDTTVLLKDALQPRLAAGSTTTPPPRLINLNTATATELGTLPGIGPKTTEKIIRARPIKDLPALDALPGFGPKTIEALRELVLF